MNINVLESPGHPHSRESLRKKGTFFPLVLAYRLSSQVLLSPQFPFTSLDISIQWSHPISLTMILYRNSSLPFFPKILSFLFVQHIEAVLFSAKSSIKVFCLTIVLWALKINFGTFPQVEGAVMCVCFINSIFSYHCKYEDLISYHS